ncbi:hypothetical protein NOVOSPHI9U_40311 [Novosphingobium sp. 9U]|nr:hypothetical protein NOVOSPHI9U_40311 [Novosphingobium sp. 9U]
MPLWWNGRRDRLKIDCRKTCPFESGQGHHAIEVEGPPRHELDPGPVSPVTILSARRFTKACLHCRNRSRIKSGTTLGCKLLLTLLRKFAFFASSTCQRNRHFTPFT